RDDDVPHRLARARRDNVRADWISLCWRYRSVVSRKRWFAMRNDRTWPASAIALMILFSACCAVFVLGQGGTGREKRNANANKNRPGPKRTPSPKKPPKPSRPNRNANSNSAGNDAGSSGTRTPPPQPVSLQSFDFVTPTVDSSGNVKSRERKSANAYAEDL